MRYSLFDLTYQAAREMGILIEGVATGGSLTSIVDTNDRSEADNYWQRGSAWIIYDAGGMGDAPEGQYSVIVSSSSSTKTLNLRTSLTASVALGDRYAIARMVGNTSWLEILISKVNQLLQGLGEIPLVDATSLTTQTNKTEYNLPIAASYNLYQVFYGTKHDAKVSDYQWIEIANYRVEYSSPGNSATLLLPYTLPPNLPLKLIYIDHHPQMELYNDVMADCVPPGLIISGAALEGLKYLRSLTGFNKYDATIALLDQKYNDARLRLRIPKPRKASRTMTIYW